MLLIGCNASGGGPSIGIITNTANFYIIGNGGYPGYPMAMMASVQQAVLLNKRTVTIT